MLLLMYALAAGSAVLLCYGLFQVTLSRLRDEDRQIDTSGSPLMEKLVPLIEVLAAHNGRIVTGGFRERTMAKLKISGNPMHLVPAEFMALKEIGAAAGFLLGLMLVALMDARMTFVFLLAIGGFFLPNLWLNEAITKRKKAIFNALPYSMDLLTLVVEAGLSFTQAIERVVEKGQRAPLRDEFSRVLQDMRLGVSKHDALEGFSERTDMAETRSFTSALIQADFLGTPLAETLRTQSEIRRTERFQRAEKMAQESPVKMLFPLLFLIFPAVFIILLTPIILKFMNEGM